MRRLLFKVSLMILLTSFNFKSVYIDPTGTYSLVSKAITKNGDIYGYTGGIQVKKITSNLIAMTFGVNMGAPSYNMGLFVDTLKYLNNKAIHTAPEDDSTCKIIFEFDKKGVRATEETVDVNSGCGFWTCRSCRWVL